MTYAERDGIKLHYETFGEGSPALVFLHPLSTNRYFWSHQLFAFARDHRVLVTDLRGHGLSDKPASGYSVDAMAADVLAILDDAAIDEAVLVGSSLGGMIAIQVALDAPKRALAMVIVSSATGLSPSVPPAVLEAYAERFEAAFDFMLQGATSAMTKATRPEVGAFLASVARTQGNFSPSTFLSCVNDPRGVFQWDVAERLAAIDAPALILAGAEDQAMPIEATRRLAHAIPRADFKVAPDVGHFYPIERPAELNAELRTFLERVVARGT